MPGMDPGTARALEYIRQFPEEEREIAEKIYFDLESLEMILLLQFFATPFIVIMSAVALSLSVVVRVDPLAFCIVTLTAFFFSRKVVVRQILKERALKKIEAVRSIIRRDKNARSGFERLKEHSSYIERIADAHYL